MTDPTALPVPCAGTLSAGERRGAERHLANRVCYARPNGTAAGVTWGVTLWDVSATGVSLILRCQLPAGTVVAVQPSDDTGAAPLLACVVRVRPHERGWLHGCTLPHPLGDDELRQWAG